VTTDIECDVSHFSPIEQSIIDIIHYFWYFSQPIIGWIRMREVSRFTPCDLALATGVEKMLNLLEDVEIEPAAKTRQFEY